MAADTRRQDKEKGWTPQEKAQGAPRGKDTGTAGDAEPKARPTDDRAATESAAAEVQRSPDSGTPARKP